MEEEQEPTKIAVQPVIPASFEKAADEWQGFQVTINSAYKNGLIPSSIKSYQQALVIALKGRELGLQPLHALATIHIINGKPGLAAELMLSLMNEKRPDIHWVWITEKDKRFEEAGLKYRRDGGEWGEFWYSVQDAVKSGVLRKVGEEYKVINPKKIVWDQQRPAMLRARCISAFVRAVAPEATMGCYTPDELETAKPTSTTAAEVAALIEGEDV